MKKPIHLTTAIYNLLIEKLKDNPIAEEILENPSHFLLHECDIFSTPELLLYVVFDINDVEYVFTEESVEAIKNKEIEIPIKRLIDHEIQKVSMKTIQDSFDEGCAIDYVG